MLLIDRWSHLHGFIQSIANFQLPGAIDVAFHEFAVDAFLHDDAAGGGATLTGGAEAAPESILCVTFTRAAADEMEKRAAKALRARGMAAKDIKPLRVVTFHGLGHQMLREKLEWKPQELNQHLISGEPRQWLSEDIIRPWRSNRTRGMNWDVEIADVLRAVDRAKEELVQPDQSHDFFRSNLSIDAELAEHYQEFFVLYEKIKQKRSYTISLT